MDGLDGDTQCDTRHHGGPDKALYAYAAEDIDWWAAELDREILPGLFGENLTTIGLDVTGALIGERWRLGARRDGCTVEVTMPRTPCPNLSHRLGIPLFHRRFAAAGRTGAYLRVVHAGRVQAGSRVIVEHRPDHDVTVGDVAVGASSTYAKASRLRRGPRRPDAAHGGTLGRAGMPVAGTGHVTGPPYTPYDRCMVRNREAIADLYRTGIG